MSMQVTAITHKRAAVFASIISQVTPSESSMIKKVAYEPMFLSHLRDEMGVKGIRRVVMHEPLSNVRPVIFLQFARGTPRTEVWRGMQGAAALRADCGKMVIAVSEDIEPANTDAVMWSLAYRANLVEDVQIEPYRSRGHAPKSGRQAIDSTMLIDATLKHPMSPLALPAREYHGTGARRSGRNWDCRRSRCARRGTAIRWGIGARRGTRSRETRWRANGRERRRYVARRRGGVTPETSVRT